MPTLTGPTLIEIQDAYASADSNNFQKLGQLAFTADGRKYRWAKVGSSALVPGNMIQSPAVDANFDTMAVQAASAIGANTIAVTLGGTAVTANMFDGGSIAITHGTGIGQVYTIASHTVQTSTTGTCTFTIEETLIVAIDTTSKATVRKNPFNGVIQAPATLTGTPLGAVSIAHAASKYCWIQSGGPCAVLSNDTAAAGKAVMVGGAAGAVIAATAGNPIVGTMMSVGVASDTPLVRLTID